LAEIFDSKPKDETFKEAQLLAIPIQSYELKSEPVFSDEIETHSPNK